MHRAAMLRAVLTLWLLLIPVSDSVAQYRFQALLDADQDASSGCEVPTPQGILRGLEVRSVATTDRAQVTGVVHEICRQGAWQQLASGSIPPFLRIDQGMQGSDTISWTLPRTALAGRGTVAVRIIAERPGSAAFDQLGQNASVLSLGAAANALTPVIPTASVWGLFALVAGVLGIAQLAFARRRPSRQGPWGLAVVLLCSLVCVDGVRPTQANAGKSGIVLEDPANDHAGFDPAVDLLRAQVLFDHAGMHVELAVNNIQDDALTADARVLFLGNSLTYSNRLPEMLQAIARQAGRTVVVESVTQGGANLDDLYRDGDALREIASGRYQLVIMQQGPSSLPESQEDLRLGALQFNPAIRASGARPALYMVWPDITRRGFFDDVRESYSNAALAVDGMFIPAGEAWRAAWRVKPSLPLYAGDQFHPSELGSYVAALSMFAELYRQTPVGLPATLALASGRNLRFDAADALIVQQAAWDAHLQYGRAGR